MVYIDKGDKLFSLVYKAKDVVLLWFIKIRTTSFSLLVYIDRTTSCALVVYKDKDDKLLSYGL